MLSNLPPGITEGMLPGNRPEDAEWDVLHEWIDDYAYENVLTPSQIRERVAEHDTAIHEVSKWATIAGQRQALLDRCLKMLRELEWGKCRNCRDYCPICGCCGQPHDDGCSLTALIRDLEAACKPASSGGTSNGGGTNGA